jgi:hypothetical protein
MEMSRSAPTVKLWHWRSAMPALPQCALSRTVHLQLLENSSQVEFTVIGNLPPVEFAMARRARHSFFAHVVSARVPVGPPVGCSVEAAL